VTRNAYCTRELSHSVARIEKCRILQIQRVLRCISQKLINKDSKEKG